MLINKNSTAPDFSLQDQNGVMRSLRDYKGKKVILYFYPKDDTPGCTTEACGFRDNYSAYKKADAVILGISPDAVKSHKKFAEKYELPFPILADEGHRVCEQYGVWGKKKYMGKEYDGVYRTTFIIDAEGLVEHIFEGVKPDAHSQEVLSVIS
jgi:peroxiredoxin Q/BCP